MGKYQNIAEVLKKKTTSMRKSYDNDIFRCNYCPTSGHSLCHHQDKCILDEDIQKVLVKVHRLNIQLGRLRQEENTQEQINRLIVERKRLFIEYYQIETNAGGY